MDRRDFLLMIGALSIAPGALAPSAPTTGATALYDDRSTRLARVKRGRRATDDLWVRTTDLPHVNDFELKPQGACRADVCVPVPKEWMRGGYFNLTAFARRVGESVVADGGYQVWSFGAIPALRGSFLSSRVAPDFALADRQGRTVHLSDFRGKKVLVLTWASW